MAAEWASERAAEWIPGPLRDLWQGYRRHRAGRIGLAVAAAMTLIAVTAPWIAPQSPIVQDLYLGATPPSAAHPLGTDELGRDVLSRVIHGARISLTVGLAAVGIALGLGTALGFAAGYYGGAVDLWLMRVVDLMLALPTVLLAVVVVAILGPSLENAMLAVGIVIVPQFARLARASVLSIKEEEYVLAMRALGASDARILIRSILPNAVPPLIVQTTLGMATAILDAAGLSFLGLGAQPPSPEWGAMMSQGRELLFRAPWVVASPGMAILVTVLGFNLAGDALRDVLDPRLR
jgi:peptide/nickel transport system permease protein